MEQEVELCAVLALGLGPLFGADHLTAGSTECRLLQREVLVVVDAGVAVEGYGQAILSK